MDKRVVPWINVELCGPRNSSMDSRGAKTYLLDHAGTQNHSEYTYETENLTLCVRATETQVFQNVPFLCCSLNFVFKITFSIPYAPETGCGRSGEEIL